MIYDRKNENLIVIFCHPYWNRHVDRESIFGALFPMPVSGSFWIFLCPFLPYLPPDSIPMFLRQWVSSGRMRPLLGNLFRIFSRDLDLSFFQWIFQHKPSQGQNIHPPIPADRSGCCRKFSADLVKPELGSSAYRNFMGNRSPFLFSHRSGRSPASKKKEKSIPPKNDLNK